MKNIKKIILGFCCTSLLLSGCIDETFPTSVATENQLASSAKATEALLWAMPAYFIHFQTVSTNHFDWGYGSIMHIRDVLTEDLTRISSNYDWYSSWALNQQMGESWARTQFIWNYYWKFVQTANNMISAIDPTTGTNTQLGYLGVGHAFRAFLYLDMAQMFEFLPNDKTNSINSSGNDVLHLTIPIVIEETSEIDARDNPRVTREKMYEFILSDLNNAEEYIKNMSRTVKTLPDLSVVYGLKARLYMWVGDYANAKTYARNAISTGNYTITSQAQWLNTVSGFNDLNTTSWMWGANAQAEDDVVDSGILNWTSWMSSETTFGYAQAEPYALVDTRMYNQISNSDFRKLSWKAPAGSVLDGKNTYTDPDLADNIPALASLKFRPGQGNTTDYKVGAACAHPIMRIEEMYFIEAEAAAHISSSEGATLLNTFMKTHRDGSYNFTPTNVESLVNEIFFQKRVEFWGEGIVFFDYKRLNKPVTRGYVGTNHSDSKRFNTTTRPAWMNFCIVQTEKNSNKALMGYENPDPSDSYTPWTGQ